MSDAEARAIFDAINRLRREKGSVAPQRTCGHVYVLGDIAYACERDPHPVDGYGPAFRHAAAIDAELAEGTNEDDGDGPATLVTWGEDGNGDGQDWEIAWGAVADYGRAAGGSKR